MKHYLNSLLCLCAPENGFAQDAIEWAIVGGYVRLEYDLDDDMGAIMGQYDEIIADYRAARAVSPRGVGVCAGPGDAPLLTPQGEQPLIDLMQTKFGLPITELTSGEERLAA